MFSGSEACCSGGVVNLNRPCSTFEPPCNGVDTTDGTDVELETSDTGSASVVARRAARRAARVAARVAARRTARRATRVAARTENRVDETVQEVVDQCTVECFNDGVEAIVDAEEEGEGYVVEDLKGETAVEVDAVVY